ncbi:MAG: hypothetical protein ATN36_02220 [Epulopiscium sp. Nele67-Bin005]|nr:MAG: hypothetical protein ATN36_02220 [Epulopiscium sp. Nele67-Bin005]
MKNELVQYLSVNSLPDFNQFMTEAEKSIEGKISLSLADLHAGTLTSIKTQIRESAIIDKNYERIYYRVNGIHRILRTNHETAQLLIYKDMDEDKFPQDRHIVSFHGTDYISDEMLKAIFDFCYNNSTEKKKVYLQYSCEFCETLKQLKAQGNLERVTVTLPDRRTKLKNDRLKRDKIKHCQFTNRPFVSKREIEFSHIDSMEYNPDRAYDIDNGVIILKKIHKKLLKQGVMNFEGMYNFCKQHGYDLQWAKNFK